MPAASAMRTSRDTRRPGVGAAATVVVLRIAGAGLLGVNAGIHAYLWSIGYRSITVIGPLFLLDVISASILTLAVLGAPRRWLALVAAAGVLLELGTAGGLILATQHSLFGFTESTQATLYWQAVFTEFAGAGVLALLAVLVLLRGRLGSASRRR